MSAPSWIYLLVRRASLSVFLVATFLIGFFLDWIELTLIILPLVSPVVINLGFDLIWFTIQLAVCLETSVSTPTVGFAIFHLKGVAPEGIHITTANEGIFPFVALQLIGLSIIFNWEAVATCLPVQGYGP